MADDPLENLSYEEKERLAELVKGNTSRRDLLKAGGALTVGAILGGGGYAASTQNVKADADTNDSYPDVGTPSNRVDVFSDGLDANLIETEQVENNPPSDELIRGRPEYHDDGVITVDIDTISETRTINNNTYEVVLLPYRVDGQINLDATGDRSSNSYLIPPYTSHRYSETEGGVSAVYVRGDPSTTGDIVKSLTFVHTNDTQSKVKGLEFAGEDPGSDENVAVAVYGSHVSTDSCTFDGASQQNGVLTYGGNGHVDIEGDTDMGGVGLMIVQKHGGTYGVLNGGVSGSAGNLTANGQGPVCAVSDLSGASFNNGLHRRDGVRAPTVNADTSHIIQGYGSEGSRAYLGAAYSLSSGSQTKIPIDSVDYDDRGEWVPSSNRITVNDAGRYKVDARVAMDSLTDGDKVLVAFSVNGTSYRDSVSATSNGVARASTSDTLNLASGDVIELFASQNSGNSSSVLAGAEETALAVNRAG